MALSERMRQEQAQRLNERRPLGCFLAMRVMQSDLYRQLDDAERADCDELVRRNLEWFKRDSAPVLRLPRWEPCNEGCDPEFNGYRSRSCKCPAALAALGVTEAPDA
jgi:hypothetical protein